MPGEYDPGIISPGSPAPKCPPGASSIIHYYQLFCAFVRCAAAPRPGESARRILIRVALRQALGRYLVASGRLEVWTDTPRAPTSGSGGDGAPVIDGDYHEVAPDDAARNERDDTAPPPPAATPR